MAIAVTHFFCREKWARGGSLAGLLNRRGLIAAGLLELLGMGKGNGIGEKGNGRERSKHLTTTTFFYQK